MELYLLYAGDSWLSTRSEELLAVCTTFDRAIQLACADAALHHKLLGKNDIQQLMENKQTYGLDTNYMIRPCKTDILDI